MNMRMEDLIISLDELKLLWKYKLNLESHFKLIINLPIVDVHDCISSDVFCANITGEVENINDVKNFMKRKMSELAAERQAKCVMLNNIPTITLSDSDSDSATTGEVLVETQNKTRKKKRKRKDPSKTPEQVVDLTSSVIIEDENICEVSSTTEVESKDKTIEIDSLSDSEGQPSTTIKEEPVPALEYIPLKTSDKKEELKNENSRSKSQNRNKGDSVIVLSDDEDIPKPATKLRRKLRPIVIDGSNVAREHGKTTKTFSSKGIQLSVEYFLNRGHTQVTAFVPNYRRHNSFGFIPTTDQPILEKLAIEQHVVFTPSRRVNGKRVTCYDDRFIVELASKTGGVILSNDNYRDLLKESDEFKKTIEERLLMFCFVGDMLMIPDDPLGRDGPKLDEFLSMPEEVENPSLTALPEPSQTHSSVKSVPKTQNTST